MTVLRAKADGLENFSIFCNHVTIIPAIKAILDSPDLRLDGFLGPGHVSTVIGCRPYEFIAAVHNKPLVCAGFEPLDILHSVAMLLEQLAEGRCEVENQYGRVVPWDGNRKALQVISEVMELRPYFEWRGLGFISHSALKVRDEYAALRRRAALRGARRAGGRPQGLPVRRGPQGRHQAVGVQGLRNGLHPRDPHRHVHGLLRGRLRRLLQLRSLHPGARPWRRSGMSRRPPRCRRAGPSEAVGEADLRVGAGPGPVGQEHLTKEQQVLQRIERARAKKQTVKEERITLAHGAGGQVDAHPDRRAVPGGLPQPAPGAAGGPGGPPHRRTRLAFTTDSYVVSPLFFPGGDIGDLAVNGTVNDLAMSGARPLYLSAGFILEEGFPVADLERIAASMAAAAEAAGVTIVTGDTKVVQKGKADGCYINTAGVGRAGAAGGAGRAPLPARRRHPRVRAHRRPRHDHHAGPGRARDRVRHRLRHGAAARASWPRCSTRSPRACGPSATPPGAGWRPSSTRWPRRPTWP